MRTALKNKQVLKYTLLEDASENFTHTDLDGSTATIEIDGVVYDVDTGVPHSVWSEPVEFIGNIQPVGTESYARGTKAKYEFYGINVADYDALLLMNRGEIPLREGSYLWHTSTVGRLGDGSVDVNTADYIVGRAAESQNIALYLLNGVSKNGSI